MEQNKDKELHDLINNIKRWIDLYKRKWLIIFLVSLLGASLGLIYAIYQKPLYKANLTFAMEEKGPAGGLGGIASQFGISLGASDGGAFSGDNVIELMKSRFLVEKTLLTTVELEGKKQLLLQRYIDFNELEAKWNSDPKTVGLKFSSDDRATFSRTQDSVLGEISKSIILGVLSVSKIDKKLSIVSVRTSSKDELFAKAFCENLVHNVTDFYVETKTFKSRANITLLQNRVDSVKRELDAAMYGRAAFSDQNFGLIKQSAAVPKLKSEMKIQMLGTMYGELVKNLEFAKVTLMREEPLIQVIDRPILPLDTKALGKKKGVLYGGLLFGFLIVAYLSIKELLKDLL